MYDFLSARPKSCRPEILCIKSRYFLNLTNFTLALRTSNPQICFNTDDILLPDFEYGVLHNQHFIVSIYGAILERSRAKMMNIEK